MQEITGAKPVREPISSARGSRGKADPPDSESGSLGRASRLAPTISKAPKSIVSDALARHASFNPVQLQVGAPVLVAVCQGGVRQDRNRASAQAGFISQLSRGQHSGLRPFFGLQALK